MNGGASRTPAAPHFARLLLARDAAPGGESDPARVAAALQRTCLRVSDSLRDSMGEDGRNALLARALARTEADHPALSSVRRAGDGGIHLDGVVTSVEAYGITAVTAAIEALLAALLEILSRLIGEDMAMRLIDSDPPRGRPDREMQAQ